MTRWAALALAAVSSVAAHAADGAELEATARVPVQLDAKQRLAYQATFAAIHAGRWLDAQLQLDTMAPGPLHAVARAELFVAKGSPKADLPALMQVLTEAPELPEASELQRLAKARGAVDLPPLPATQALIWQDGAPARVRAKTVRSDLMAADLAVAMQPLVKADDGMAAEALLIATHGLTPEAQTEWQERVAWIYYLAGDDVNARRVAGLAAESAGEWAVQARWTAALAAWRQADWAAAAQGFDGVAARADNADLRAAALYWTARAAMAGGRPDRISTQLTAAAQFGETFYGQLARQALGLKAPVGPVTGTVAADWLTLEKRPNLRVAAALAEIGETELADRVIRQQARIGAPAEFAALVRVAEALDLPATAVWLAHNCPTGVTAGPQARYPMPSWSPDRGWRVDKALLYAHALQESQFRTRVVSPAGAYGLMQIMPAVATDYARENGLASVDRNALAIPSTNMELGQRQLERLRDMPSTGGLLPKVIAAYNAGPKPVGEWNALVRDGGDPLLYIESIPYWETRGYVVTVLRNYWIYEANAGRTRSVSRAALAQGLWPRFPGMPGATAVRLDMRFDRTATASINPDRLGTD